ncbi:MAG: hypothetical protein Q8R69_21365 [Telluria sp.]|nr:hypothetical protein [Telluria sp.]
MKQLRVIVTAFLFCAALEPRPLPARTPSFSIIKAAQLKAWRQSETGVRVFFRRLFGENYPDPVFDARFFEETPQPVLQQLAAAHARTLAQLFGGPDRLRAELRNQRIDADRLSPELLEAFKPYFAR